MRVAPPSTTVTSTMPQITRSQMATARLFRRMLDRSLGRLPASARAWGFIDAQYRAKSHKRYSQRRAELAHRAPLPKDGPGGNPPGLTMIQDACLRAT